MARGTNITDKQVNILLQAVDQGKTQAEACILAGLDPSHSTRTFASKRVVQRRLELDAERRLRERIANTGVEEPLTLREFQAEVKARMLDPNNREAAKYFEMYGKTIRAFTDKVEIEETTSYADVLAKRKKDKAK